jgi:hypothetical protein
MTEYHESKMLALVGEADGINRIFETPSKFVVGTLRVFVNGQACEATDDRKGWHEQSDNVVVMTRAPRSGDVLQAFYQDKDISGQLGLSDVVGSPYDPRGIMP